MSTEVSRTDPNEQQICDDLLKSDDTRQVTTHDDRPTDQAPVEDAGDNIYSSSRPLGSAGFNSGQVSTPPTECETEDVQRLLDQQIISSDTNEPPDTHSGFMLDLDEYGEWDADAEADEIVGAVERCEMQKRLLKDDWQMDDTGALIEAHNSSYQPLDQHHEPLSVAAKDTTRSSSTPAANTIALSSNAALAEVRSPIVRKPFPARAADRSPILGLSPAMVIRTCFRIGEALNTGCDAARRNENVILELFARLESTVHNIENGRGREFVFADLYHFRPPKLTGTQNPSKDDEMWDQADREILQGSSGVSLVCRCLCRMRRIKNAWQLEVIHVRPSTWDEIDRTRIVVCA